MPVYSSELDNDTLLRLIGSSLQVKNGQDVNYCLKIIRKFLAAEDIREDAAERVISEIFKQRWGSKQYTAIEFQRIFEALTDDNGTFITMNILERRAKKKYVMMMNMGHYKARRVSSWI